MKTLSIFFLGFLACLAEAREQWRVERYADKECSAFSAQWSVLKTEPLKPENFSWLPRITPGWPLRGGKWLIKWEGTF